MGGNQSQERVVNVEESAAEDGAAQITVTEDFLRYLHDKQVGDSTTEGESRDRKDESHDQEYDDDDDEGLSDYDEATPPPPYMSAENVLSGDQTAESASRRQHSSREAERWREKYNFEKRKNQTVKELTSRNFDQTAREIRERFEAKTKQPARFVCEESKDKVLDCYHSNPKRPLNCTNEAKEFFICVEQARRRSVEATATQ